MSILYYFHHKKLNDEEPDRFHEQECGGKSNAVNMKLVAAIGFLFYIAALVILLVL